MIDVPLDSNESIINKTRFKAIFSEFRRRKEIEQADLQEDTDSSVSFEVLEPSMREVRLNQVMMSLFDIPCLNRPCPNPSYPWECYALVPGIY